MHKGFVSSVVKLFCCHQTLAWLALAALIGVLLGMPPFLSPHKLILLIVCLALPCNVLVVLAGLLVGTILSLVLTPAFHALGGAVLTADLFYDFWTQSYNNAVWRFLRFNNTIVAGSLLSSVTLLLFFLFVCCLPIHRAHLPAMMRCSARSGVVGRITGRASPVLQLLARCFYRPGEGSLRRLLLMRSLIAAITVVIVALGGWFYAIAALERQLNRHASALMGASVEIGGVALSLSPLSIELQDVTAADQHNRDKKRLHITSLSAEPSLYHLATGRWVFDNVVASGLRLLPTHKDPLQMDKVRPLAISDHWHDLVQGIDLGREDFFARNFSETLRQEFDQWYQKVVSLDGFYRHRRHLRVLHSGKPTSEDREMVRKIADFRHRVQQEVMLLEAALRWCRQARGNVASERGNIESSLDTKLQRIMDKALSRMFDDIVAARYIRQVQRYVRQISQWYDFSQIAGGSGEMKKNVDQKFPIVQGDTVIFEEFDPQPRFNVRKAQFSYTARDRQRWEGELKNFHFQRIATLPTHVQIGEVKHNPLVLKGSTFPADTEVHSKWTIEKKASIIQKKVILSLMDHHLEIGRSLYELGGSVEIARSAEVKGHVQFFYDQILWQGNDGQDTAAVAALDGLREFFVDIDISGTTGSILINPNSTFDERLKKIFAIRFADILDGYRFQVQEVFSDRKRKILSNFDLHLLNIFDMETKVLTKIVQWRGLLNEISSVERSY